MSDILCVAAGRFLRWLADCIDPDGPVKAGGTD